LGGDCTGDTGEAAWSAGSGAENPENKIRAGCRRGIPGCFSRHEERIGCRSLREIDALFPALTLQFTGGLEYDLFARSVRTVRDTLTLPAFQPVRSAIEQRHARYLTLRLGLFAADLMRQGDPLAEEILNRHGAGPFCRFLVRGNEFAGRKGVFMVYVQGRVCHTGACHVPFSSGIEEHVGRIMPDMCYRDGDGTACRINRIVGASRPAPALYVHGMTDDAEIDACAAALGLRYPPIAAERLGKDAKRPRSENFSYHMRTL
jgi:hypothetical protein